MEPIKTNTRANRLDVLAWNNNLAAVADALEHHDFTQQELDFSLYKACHEGHLKVVDLLMDYGAKLEQTGVLNGFMAACSNKHLNVVMFLLDKGADVHFNNDQALIDASKSGFEDVVELLLDAGADVHAQNDKALMNASVHNQPHIVDILMYAGADAKLNNAMAFNTACRKGYIGVVEAFLEHGVDACANHNSASFNAKNFPRITKLLQIYGAGEHELMPKKFYMPQHVDFKFEKFLNMVLSAQIEPEAKDPGKKPRI